MMSMREILHIAEDNPGIVWKLKLKENESDC